MGTSLRTLYGLLTGTGLLLAIPNVSLAQKSPESAEPSVRVESLKEREPVGEVLGKVVYRDQTIPPEAASPSVDLRVRRMRERSHLSGLFLHPLIAKFQKDHEAEIAPTKEELQFTHSFFLEHHRKKQEKEEEEWKRQRKEIEEKLKGSLSEEERRKLVLRKAALEGVRNPPSEQLASYLMKNLKWQRYLYRHYGGGRLLFQQGGVEAFDAMRRWIEEREQQGDFKVTDPEMRARLYEYWTEWDHGPFLTDDPKRIESWLNPEWAPKSSFDVSK